MILLYVKARVARDKAGAAYDKAEAAYVKAEAAARPGPRSSPRRRASELSAERKDHLPMTPYDIDNPVTHPPLAPTVDPEVWTFAAVRLLGLPSEPTPTMKLYRVALTCDHDALVSASSPEEALKIADQHTGDHWNSPDLLPDTLYEVDLSQPSFVALVDGLV